ncbi:alpha/beta hydrolase [Gemmatimonadetes bacterium T265]|nr:alpha/beta hydrolase [Gemmatimonadetes bacterium T265]
MPPPSYRPAWWVPGAHAQTLYGKFVRQGRRAPARDARVRTERWDTPDVDFVDVVRLDAESAAPRFLLLHGLEGGERSHYVQGMFEQARRRGWGMDVLIHRSCGADMNRQRRFYHSGETSDLALVVARVAAERPDRPLFLAGVSLGGNVLLKYLGERGPLGPGSPNVTGEVVPANVKGAVAISVPYDLARGARHIGKGFSRVYERNFLRSLVAKVERKLEVYPDLVDRARLAELRTLWDFDDVLTAGVHGFTGAEDYYARSSALGYLGRIGTPTLLLSAVDDPFLPPEVLDEVRGVAEGNRCLAVEFHARGGHVGFVGGRVPWRADYYAERRTFEWAEGRVGRAVVAVAA